ncbi:hypothetical protein ACNUDM_08310 [Vibrio chaetopteri]|uniref:hypothetical protein n=1 Tax=Vibrio chaetopteri TaxID=3016528 RepID=UPI003AB2E505
MKHYFLLTAQDGIIISQNNATTGEHQTLDYIPGSALLGALAAKDYPKDEQLAWSLFHSGEVVFHHCLPVVDQHLALPMPLSWHHKKGDSKEKVIEGWINQGCASFSREANTQYEQLRGHYLTHDGKQHKIKLATTTKTAIDRETGTAAEAKLFNYQYIQPEQTFLGCIECPDALDEEVKQRLNATLRIGRSKGAEFGRVTVSPIDFNDHWKQSLTNTRAKQLTLWCASDIEILDELGSPTIAPTPEQLHPLLSEACILSDQTFIRYHSINRFNAYRQCYDSESRLISRGSIITLSVSENLDLGKLQGELAAGIGINRHIGQGQVIVNPPWAEQVKPEPTIHSAKVSLPSRPSKEWQPTMLTQWIESQIHAVNSQATQHQQALTLVESLIQAYRNARAFNRHDNAHQAGPSRSQWRRINDELRGDHAEGWYQAAFEGERAICKTQNDELGWGIQWMSGNRLVSFSQTLKNQIDELTNTYSPREVRDIALKTIEILTRVDPSEHRGLSNIASQLKEQRAASESNTKEAMS